jgi:hypothetical protein
MNNSIIIIQNLHENCNINTKKAKNEESKITF